jgi:hypothetical protein
MKKNSTKKSVSTSRELDLRIEACDLQAIAMGTAGMNFNKA